MRIHTLIFRTVLQFVICLRITKFTMRQSSLSGSLSLFWGIPCVVELLPLNLVLFIVHGRGSKTYQENVLIIEFHHSIKFKPFKTGLLIRLSP